MLSYTLQTLIDRRGQVATLNKVTVGSYSPSTGSSSTSSTPHTIKAYFGNYGLSEKPSDSITYGDRLIVIRARDTSGVAIPEPHAEDTISGVGDTVVIKSVQKIYNSGTLVCYLCGARE